MQMYEILYKRLLHICDYIFTCTHVYSRCKKVTIALKQWLLTNMPAKYSRLSGFERGRWKNKSVEREIHVFCFFKV